MMLPGPGVTGAGGEEGWGVTEAFATDAASVTFPTRNPASFKAVVALASV